MHVHALRLLERCAVGLRRQRAEGVDVVDDVHLVAAPRERVRQPAHGVSVPAEVGRRVERGDHREAESCRHSHRRVVMLFDHEAVSNSDITADCPSICVT